VFMLLLLLLLQIVFRNTLWRVSASMVMMTVYAACSSSGGVGVAA